MKTLITIFILSLVSKLTCAQQNFEGKIVYAGNFLGKEEITVFFGNNKLLTKTSPIDSINGNNKDFLVDFTTGVVYYLDRLTKTYSSKNITDSKSDFPALTPWVEKNETILGHHCSAYKPVDRSTDKPERSPFSIFYADDLYYHVKEEYTHMQGLQFFTNGKNVGMGIEIEANDNKKQGILPVSIAAENISDSIFSLAGFERHSITVIDTEAKEDADAIAVRVAADSAVKAVADSVVKVIDSIISAMEKKQDIPTKSKPKKSSPKNTHTQPTKSPAIKPKQ